MEHPSTGTGVEGVVRRNPSDGTVTISGRVTGLGSAPQKIIWIAAAPVTRGIGFMGSGQPYPNRDIALSNTPNRGSLESPDGSFSISLVGIPAGYYSELGSTYVPPLVEFLSTTRDGKRLHTSLWINDTAAPYRWGSGAPAPLRPAVLNPESSGRAMYYAGRDTMPLFDNQEAQLRAKAYPCENTGRGWPSAEDAKPWAHVPPPA
jgi:hypothetical protein